MDAVLNNPSGGLGAELSEGTTLAEGLAGQFSPGELEELVLTAAMACGFSKAAIAWGPPPEMPLAEMPTPSPENSLI